MKFEEMPDWLIAGPVVCKDNVPIFTRHQIHLDLSKHYVDLDDVLFIEGIVRDYVTDYKENKVKTIEELLTIMTRSRLKQASLKKFLCRNPS